MVHVQLQHWLHFCLVIVFLVLDAIPAATINKHKQDAANETATSSSWSLNDLPEGFTFLIPNSRTGPLQFNLSHLLHLFFFLHPSCMQYYTPTCSKKKPLFYVNTPGTEVLDSFPIHIFQGLTKMIKALGLMLGWLTIWTADETALPPFIPPPTGFIHLQTLFNEMSHL